jgi:hypothetical protein
MEIVDYKAQNKEDLKDPRWLELEKKIRKRDNDRCQACGRKKRKGMEMNVHHLHYYPNHKPWEYEESDLITLCRDCHIDAHDRINFDSLKIGDCFYHKFYHGVGFVDGKEENEILASVCWAKVGNSDGQLYNPRKLKYDEIRPATKEELWDFWDRVATKYNDDFIFYHLKQNLYKLSFEHPLWDRIRIRMRNATGKFQESLLFVHDKFGKTLLVSDEDFAEFTNARHGAISDWSIPENVFPAAQFRITKKCDLESQEAKEYKIISFEEIDFEKYRSATDDETNYYCQIRGISADDLYSVLPPDAHLEEELRLGLITKEDL